MQDILDGIVFHIERPHQEMRAGIQMIQVGIQAHFIPPNLSMDDVYSILATRTRNLLTDTVRQFTVVMPDMDQVGFYVEGRSDADHAIVANNSNVVPFEQITFGLFEGLFANVLQSQENIQLQDIIWYFTVNPNNLLYGGAPKVTRPNYIRKKWMYSSWVGYDDVGCAAYAIALAIKQASGNRNDRPDYVKTKALEIQETMNWGLNLTQYKVLDFVDHPDYNDYAIGILSAHSIKFPISCHNYREGINYDFEQDKASGFKKRIYICLDLRQKHYGCVDKLALANPSKQNSSEYSHKHWCNKCHCSYYQGSLQHTYCEGQIVKRQKTDDTPTEKKCSRCKQSYLSTIKHVCPTYQCKICKSMQQRNKNNHRCPLLPSDFRLPKKKQENMIDGEAQEGEEEDEENEELIEFVTMEAQLDKGYTCLFAYDFESCIDVKKRSSKQIIGFEMDENGQYKVDENGNPVLKEVNGMDYTMDYSHHRVNLICYKNVFLDQPTQTIKDFSPVDTKEGILEFIHFALDYNNGNNIFYAHNASGYDSRLLFQAMQELNLPVEMKPVTRGGKFIEISVKRWEVVNGERKLMKTIFRDSMLHLGGGLKSLGLDFCKDVGMEKGHFPHLFNKPENFGYSGPLPSLESFDFTFSAKSKKDLDEAISWWNERREEGEWSFEQEIIKYCKNDVDMLAEIMKKFHDITVEWFKYSPWYQVAYIGNTLLCLPLPTKCHFVLDLKKFVKS